MRVKLGLKKYTLHPDSLRVMIQVEKMANKPIYKIDESLQDQLIYMFVMFQCAGFSLGWFGFTLLLTDKVVSDVLKFYKHFDQERAKKEKPGENTRQAHSSEKVSAHEMLYQYSIISGMAPEKILQMSELELEAILTAYERTKRDTWEQARLMAFCAISPHLEGKPKINDWLPLDWEQFRAQAPSMSREKYEKLTQQNRT